MATSPFSTTVLSVGAVAQLMFNDPAFSVFFAGCAGGMVRWRYMREPFWSGIGSVATGGICGKYLGPFAISVLEKQMSIELSNDRVTTGALLMGLGGILFIDLIFKSFGGGSAGGGGDAKPD